MSTVINSNTEERDDNFDHLIYMRVYEGCNLHCKHCFIPANPKKMTIDTVKSVSENIRKFAKKGQILLFQWHGGEPTAIGIRFMREALEIINKDLSDDFVVKHGIQTNLISYNEKWKDLYLKYFKGKIGISWDPEIRLMKKGVQESNVEYEKIFWENVKKLKSDGIEPYLVITGTKPFFESFRNPNVFFNMLLAKGIKKTHIEKLTKTGNAIDNWDNIGLSYKEYSKYMSKMMRSYAGLRNNNNEIFISPFDGYLESVQSMGTAKPIGYGCNSGKCDTAFHTVDSTGYIAGCTALTTNEQSKKSGVVEFTGLRTRRDEKTRSCFNCKYKTICNSGCATEITFDTSGECSGGYLIYEQAEKIIKRNLLG